MYDEPSSEKLFPAVFSSSTTLDSFTTRSVVAIQSNIDRSISAVTKETISLTFSTTNEALTPDDTAGNKNSYKRRQH